MVKKRVSKTKMAKSVGWEKGPEISLLTPKQKRTILEEAAKLNAARALENSQAMGEVPAGVETVSDIEPANVGEAVPPRPVRPSLGDDDFVNKRLAVLEWDLHYGSQNAPPEKPKTGQEWLGGLAERDRLQDEANSKMQAEYRPDGYGGVEKPAEESKGSIFPPMSVNMRDLLGIPPKPAETPVSNDERKAREWDQIAEKWDAHGVGSWAENARNRAKELRNSEKKSEVAGEDVPDWAREAQERRDKAAAAEREERANEPNVFTPQEKYVPSRPTPVNPDPLRDIKVAVTNYNLAEIPNFWDKLWQQIKRRFYERVERFVEKDRRKLVIVKMPKGSMAPMDKGELERQMAATGRTVLYIEYSTQAIAPPSVETLP